MWLVLATVSMVLVLLVGVSRGYQLKQGALVKVFSAKREGHLQMFLGASVFCIAAASGAIVLMALGVIGVLSGARLVKSHDALLSEVLQRQAMVSSSERQTFCVTYVKRYPNQVARLLPMLSTPNSASLIKRLNRLGVKLEGKSLAFGVAVRLLRSGEPEVLCSILEAGGFDDEPALKEAIEGEIGEVSFEVWDSVLSERDHQRLGHVLRRVLEDGLTFRRQGLSLVIRGERFVGETCGRTLKMLRKMLSEHLGRASLKVLEVSAEDFEERGGGPADLSKWWMMWEVVDWDGVEVSWSKINIGGLSGRETKSSSNESLQVVEAQQSLYPLLKLRCSMFRGQRQEAMIELDSSHGLEMLMDNQSIRRGSHPMFLAADMLHSGMLQGLGLRFTSAHRVSGDKRPSELMIERLRDAEVRRDVVLSPSSVIVSS